MPLLPILWGPQCQPLTNTVGGLGGQWPEGRTPTPKPSRKKERDAFSLHTYTYTPYTLDISITKAATQKVKRSP